MTKLLAAVFIVCIIAGCLAWISLIQQLSCVVDTLAQTQDVTHTCDPFFEYLFRRLP